MSTCYHCKAVDGEPHAERCPSTCPHNNLVPEPCDQTLGVACNDCNLLLGCCWMDRHVSEAVWNRAVANVRARNIVEHIDAEPCEQSRDNVCFLCGEEFADDECAKGDRP